MDNYLGPGIILTKREYRIFLEIAMDNKEQFDIHGDMKYLREKYNELTVEDEE